MVAADAIKNPSVVKVVSAEAIPADLYGLDIGPEAVKEYTAEIKQARTVIWNGPMGVF